MASIHETKSVFDKVGGENEDKFMSLNETGKKKKKKKLMIIMTLNQSIIINSKWLVWALDNITKIKASCKSLTFFM